MSKKISFKLNITKAPFYTVLKSNMSRKDILFTLTMHNQIVNIDEDDITPVALYFIKAGIESDFIKPLNEKDWSDYLNKIEQKEKEEKGGDKEEVKEENETSDTKENEVEFDKELVELMNKGTSKIKNIINKKELELDKEEFEKFVEECLRIEEAKEEPRSTVIKMLKYKLNKEENDS